MNRRWWGELAVVLGVTILANLLVSPHSPGWVGLQPHPFLAPLCLVASRYGSPLAALLTALLFGYYEVVTGGANPLQPPHAALWASCIVTAALVGALFDQYRHRHHQLQQDLTESQQQLRVLREQNEVLESAVAELRGRVLGASQTFGSLYGTARQLTTLSPEQLYRGCLELLCKQTEASQVHLFLVEQGDFQALAHHPPDSLPRLSPQASPLVQKAVERGSLCTAQELGERADPLDPLIVVPLRGEGGVRGLITIDSLPFRRFQPTTLAEIESIGDWTARALSQLKLYHRQEQLVAENQAAQLRVLQQLRTIRLLPRDLPLLGAGAEPMGELLLDALLAERWQPLLRSNILTLLEFLQIGSDRLKAFVAQEIAWLGQAHRDLHGLYHQGCATQLTLLHTYLRYHLALRRQHLCRAQRLVRPLSEELWQELQSFPLAQSGPVSLSQGLIQWAGPELLEALESTAGLPPRGEGHISLEELLLDFLGRPDLHLVCATLHALGRLARETPQRSWLDLGPGSLASLARELTEHPDGRVREAAGWSQDQASPRGE